MKPGEELVHVCPGCEQLVPLDKVLEHEESCPGRVPDATPATRAGVVNATPEGDTIKLETATPKLPAWFDFEPADLATAIDDVDKWLKAQREKLGPSEGMAKAMRARLTEKMRAANAKAVAHPYLIVELEATYTNDVRISVLREKLDALVKAGKIPADELAKGLYLHQPPPEWKVNLTKLKPLGKYGDDVTAAINEGVVRVVGEPKLTVKPNPKVIEGDKHGDGTKEQSSLQ